MPVICNSCFDAAEAEIDNLTDEQFIELVGEDPSTDDIKSFVLDSLNGKFSDYDKAVVWNGSGFQCVEHYFYDGPDFIIEEDPDEDHVY